MEDSLKVEVDEETGTVHLDWDPNDTKWSWLNGLTSDEIGTIISRYLQSLQDELSYEESESSI